MTTPDYKPRFQIALAPTAGLKAVCLGFGLLALMVTTTLTILSATPWPVKAGLLLALYLSFVPLKNYLVMLSRVSEIRVDDDQFVLVYAGRPYQVICCASPIVTSWMVMLPLRRSAKRGISFAKQSAFTALYQELKEWFFLPGGDRSEVNGLADRPAPQFFNLILLEKSCSAADLARLRAYLLTRASAFKMASEN